MNRRTRYLAAIVLGSLAVGYVGLSAVHPVRANKIASKSQSGYHLPFTNSERGRDLFVNKGCVVCHSVNGAGGEVGPRLNAEPTQAQIDPFDFAARMWRGAEAMIAFQNMELGFQIELTGEELVHIARFLHDLEAQQTFSEDEIPANIRRLMRSELLKDLDL